MANVNDVMDEDAELLTLTVEQTVKNASQLLSIEVLRIGEEMLSTADRTLHYGFTQDVLHLMEEARQDLIDYPHNPPATEGEKAQFATTICGVLISDAILAPNHHIVSIIMKHPAFNVNLVGPRESEDYRPLHLALMQNSCAKLVPLLLSHPDIKPDMWTPKDLVDVWASAVDVADFTYLFMDNELSKSQAASHVRLLLARDDVDIHTMNYHQNQFHNPDDDLPFDFDQPIDQLFNL